MLRKSILLFSAIILIACNDGKSSSSATEDNTELSSQIGDSFDWLLGKWKRINEEKDKSTYEFWERIANNEYSGFGFTLKEADTIWQERMRLVKDTDVWSLYIQSPEDPQPVAFVMTFSNGNSFTCENPMIELPQKIKYWKWRNGIQASVSNDEMEITFEFSKIK